MKIADILLILDHLRRLYVAAGAKTAANDLKTFSDALRPHADVPVDRFVSTVQDRLARQAAASKPVRRAKPTAPAKPRIPDEAIIVRQIDLLRTTGTDRSAFDTAFAALKADKRLTVAELAEIARRYADTVTKYKSKSSALDDISKAFVRQARFENKLR